MGSCGETDSISSEGGLEAKGLVVSGVDILSVCCEVLLLSVKACLDLWERFGSNFSAKKIFFLVLFFFVLFLGVYGEVLPPTHRETE